MGKKESKKNVNKVYARLMHAKQGIQVIQGSQHHNRRVAPSLVQNHVQFKTIYKKQQWFVIVYKV